MNEQQGVALKELPKPKTASFLSTWWPYLVLAGVVLFLFAPVLKLLVRDWYIDPDFSHGFLVPIFSGYLIWKKRQSLAALEMRPMSAGIIVVGAGLAGLVAGTYGAELFVSRVSFLIVLAGLVLTFAGTAMLRLLAFPIAILLFAIPIPAIIFNQITFPLQLLASRLSAEVLPLLGVPVLREGNVIHLPAMPLEVAEACSGIRSLMSLTTLAIIYGSLLETKTWARVALALSGVPIAVASNATRVIGTGLCVQYWNADKALGFFHEFSGWVMFMVSLAMLYGFHALIRQRRVRSAQ